jgi:hypothetical protein
MREGRADKAKLGHGVARKNNAKNYADINRLAVEKNHITARCDGY